MKYLVWTVKMELQLKQFSSVTRVRSILCKIFNEYYSWLMSNSVYLLHSYLNLTKYKLSRHWNVLSKFKQRINWRKVSLTELWNMKYGSFINEMTNEKLIETMQLNKNLYHSDLYHSDLFKKFQLFSIRQKQQIWAL